MRQTFSTPQRIAWTGGDVPRRGIVLSDTTFAKWYRYIRHLYFREQLDTWREYWGDLPKQDTNRIFWNRASLDAWATLRHSSPALFRKVNQ